MVEPKMVGPNIDSKNWHQWEYKRILPAIISSQLQLFGMNFDPWVHKGAFVFLFAFAILRKTSLSMNNGQVKSRATTVFSFVHLHLFYLL